MNTPPGIQYSLSMSMPENRTESPLSHRVRLANLSSDTATRATRALYPTDAHEERASPRSRANSSPVQIPNEKIDTLALHRDSDVSIHRFPPPPPPRPLCCGHLLLALTDCPLRSVVRKADFRANAFNYTQMLLALTPSPSPPMILGNCPSVRRRPGCSRRTRRS